MTNIVCRLRGHRWLRVSRPTESAVEVCTRCAMRIEK